jgi:hypothetical protein
MMPRALWLAILLLVLTVQVAVGAPSTIVLSVDGMT